QNFTLNLNNGEYNWSINCTDNSNNIGASETRNITIDIIPPEVIIPFEIAFVEPTPPDLTQTTNTSIEVNISITWMENLTTFIWDWNGTNYSIYDGDLALMLNFENNSALGENDTYVVDISRYGNNGTVENGTTWTSDGKFFGGYSFDGVDDYIDFGDVNEAEDTSGTFIFWVKRSNTNSSSSAVISKSYTIENIARWVTVSNNGSGTLSIFDGSWHTVTINGGIDEEEWEHIAAVWGTQGMKIYLNGELKGSDPYTGNGYTGSFPLVLGEWKEQIAGNYGFKGTLDEVRIYNRSLSQEEIQQHYYSTLYKYDVDKWAFYTNQSNLSLGNYTYYAKATDMDNNENMTETRNVEIVEEIVADNNPPLINLELPEDNATNTTTNSIDFTYNVSDASSLDNCTLIINEEINMTDTTMQKDTPGQNFTVYLPNADYLWSINCTDSSNNIGSSETRNLSVDYISAESTPPIVNLELPEDNTTNITTNTIDFTYNVSDASDVINCSLIINNQINISDSTNISKETTNNLTTYLPDATYNWSVNCTDESNNIGNSETRTITVTFNDIVAPTINLEMPKAGARNITSKTIDFTYNFSEDREIANCTLIIQNQINVTDTNMLNDTAGQNLTAYLPNGAYNWSVNCTDNSNNIGASETRTIKVLDANISITLNPNILYGTGSTDVAGTANLTDFNNLTYQDVFLYIDEVCLTCNYILGDGSDGVVTISSTETVINEYTHLEQNATAGDTILIVNDTTGFSNGDEILIVQMQGNTTTTEPGTYEFIRNITVDNGTQISFPTGLLNEYSTGVFNNNVTANYVTQIISVPNYENLTITGSVTAPSWNGYEGGIVVFKVNDTLTIQEGASINVSARGFRGGLNGTSGFLTGGYKSDPGESIMGLGVPDSQQPNYGGGGAGKLDPAGGTGGAGGGGGGSYGGKGTDGETILGGTGGKAGNIIGREDSQLLMLGSGGGGGAEGDAGNMAGMYSGRGGNGSGAVYIIGKNIIVNGVIEANGESGYNGSGPVGFIPWYGAGGGGGSGGLIYLKAENLFLDDTTTDSTLIAEGANGGYSVSNGTEIGMGGDGGNGSYGRIRLDYLTLNGFAGRNEGVEENTTNPDPEHTDTFMESTLKTNSLGNYTYELPSPITDGNYTIKVNSTYYWITIEAEEVLTVLTLDTTPPTINLEMPENNEINTTTNVIDFTYNVSDNSDIDNCSMIINEEINLTYSGNITKETTQNLTTYLPNGEYKWSINCTDAENNEGSSETRNITIAVNTIPNFELIYDFSLDEDFGVLNINLQDNVSDAEDADSSLTYNWTVNDTSILTLHIINTTGIATFTSQANASGSVLVAISVVDTGGLSNSTEFTIT
ncbi:MAG: LamG domain-containing protein, partial [Candidatus Nanoarchaeia archaeon]